MIWRDLKYALRILWQRPAYAAVAILSLALGVGACTAIFSVVDAVLWRSLPFASPLHRCCSRRARRQPIR